MGDDLHTRPGPLLLLAGPGTGKTYRLAKRIKYLVETEGVSPEEITVITFTAAAARNMRQRISDAGKQELFLPLKQQPKHIRTMHSLGYAILKEDPSVTGVEEPEVVDSLAVQTILMEDAAQLAGYTRADAPLAGDCRRCGNCSASSSTKCGICKQYRNILRACRAIDYDDQILLACKVLSGNSDLLARYRLSCKHLLIDEYQDINAAQFKLIRMLCDGQEEGLFVVGDDDQSIYSWRGGSPEFIRRFRKDFGDKARVEPLLVSFRCHPHVLEGATSVVEAFDGARLPKGQFSYKAPDGPQILLHDVPSDEKEATIVKAIVEEAIPSKDVLILVPHRGFASAVAAELRRARIPFSAPASLPGDGLPMLATIGRWLSNPDNSLALRECIESCLANPALGIPSRRVRKAEKKKQREDGLQRISRLWAPQIKGDVSSFWQALLNASDGDVLLTSIAGAFSKALDLYKSSQVGEFSLHVMDNLLPWKDPTSLLDEVQSWVSAGQSLSHQANRTDVQLMTLQGAKGLEARVVCVIGIEDGTLPHKDASRDALAEEARLFYVSATRAIDELHLFHARKRSGHLLFRNVYPESGAPDLVVSRFINAISPKHLKRRFHPA